jgi:hypothetical protein
MNSFGIDLGGETINDAPAGAPAIARTAVLLERLAALETAIGRVTDLSDALAPATNGGILCGRVDIDE